MQKLIPILALLYFLPAYAAKKPNLPVLVPIQDVVDCEPKLLAAATPIDSAQVVDFTQDVTVHRSTLDANGKTFAFAERRILIDNPSMPFRVSQVDISPFIVIDSDGQKILTHQHLEYAARKYATDKKLGPVQYFYFEQAQLLPDGMNVAFSFRTKSEIHCVLLFNIKTFETRPVLQGLPGDSGFAPVLNVQHQRYLIAQDSHTVVIYDLKKKIKIQLFDSFIPAEGRSWAEIPRLSADGKKILFSADLRTEKKSHNFQNFLINIENSWKELEGFAYDANSLGKIKKFSGYIVAFSGDLQKFVIDKSHKIATAANWKDPISFPYLTPDLVILEIDKTKLNYKPLPDWQTTAQKIAKAATQNTVITVDGYKGSMTPDGRYFALNINFQSSRDVTHNGNARRRHSFNQNLIQLWDLKNDLNPIQHASSDLDTQNDIEPNPSRLGQYTSRVWLRDFSTRLLNDGRVVVTRIVAQGKSGAVSNVIFKAAVLSPTGDVVLKEYDAGPLNLNPYDENPSWTGVHSLQISPNGKTAIFAITGFGLKMIANILD